MVLGAAKAFRMQRQISLISVRKAFFIKALKPNLNVHSEKIRAKVFSEYLHLFMLILRVKIALNAVLCMISYFFIDDGVMTTPKRRILPFVFYRFTYY